MFRLVASGEIESFKIGKRRKIHRDALNGYIERVRSDHAAMTAFSSEHAAASEHREEQDLAVSPLCAVHVHCTIEVPRHLDHFCTASPK